MLYSSFYGEVNASPDMALYHEVPSPRGPCSYPPTRFAILEADKAVKGEAMKGVVDLVRYGGETIPDNYELAL
jgi:hypothetical protein